jgi:uncharacterized OB-fold protein
MEHPAVYWRQQKTEKLLLGQVGTILSLTKNIETQQWIGIIKFKKNRITRPIIVYQRIPAIGDKVIGVLRIMETDGEAGLIKYGIKFKLMKE